MTDGQFEYTFTYMHKATGELHRITEYGDNYKEAEQKAYEQVFAVVDENGLDLIDTDENVPRYEKSEGERKSEAWYNDCEMAINDGEW